ncbi:hypothetical protein Kpol_1041p3 [Vanderwaltozyma polyspora DSM 70294]|uniref:AMP-activated protein kinase glycogen-binding domain-containing protein n=1 Tax=Vanderwaltozyma polyspora (strain ATCC 22028 / DSM 70294 / BCRC 21397 / CBS 2163 / NBRC 10782 / NRRL Y-8283 / UCD 57-17) TaxID=436907 RepID=A7TL71_VANPO|nr:uncharacterized protein Kpol_1041p3 [Vanderwaltozyma polyspora DSM 70294]EDO16946.1 hypothetical protein Kpol_1041p3 [Vanderwaltozyma polyspora DSM 70294]
MATQFTFRWPKGPNDVILTGDFDNWKGTLPMVRTLEDDFEITLPVELSEEDKDKFYFKFIVDGNWTVNDNYQKELDPKDCVENNFITKDDMFSTSQIKSAIPESGGLLAANSAQSTQRGPPSTSNKKKRKNKNKKKNKKKKSTKKEGANEPETESSRDGTPGHEGEEDGEEIEATNEELTSTPATKQEENEEKPPVTTIEDKEVPLVETKTDLVEPTKEEPVKPEEVEEEDLSQKEAHILPVETKTPLNKFGSSIAPGPVMVKNPSSVKEFYEVSDVNAKELNQRLNQKESIEAEEGVPTLDPNAQPKQEMVEQAAVPAEAVVQKETKAVAQKVTKAPTSEKAKQEQQPKEQKPESREKPKPESRERPKEKPKKESKPSSPTKKTPLNEPRPQEKKKKKGIFSKLKKFFS